MSWTVTQAVEKLQKIWDDSNGVQDYWIRSKIQEVITDLTNPDIILSEWSIEDVLAKAEEQDLVISTEDARRILADMDHHHDASIGINWDVISAYLDNPDYNAMLIDTESEGVIDE